jgi:hypothetical protein
MSEAKYYPHKTSRMELESEDEEDESNSLKFMVKRNTVLDEKRRMTAQ